MENMGSFRGTITSMFPERFYNYSFSYEQKKIKTRIMETFYNLFSFQKFYVVSSFLVPLLELFVFTNQH